MGANFGTGNVSSVGNNDELPGEEARSTNNETISVYAVGVVKTVPHRFQVWLFDAFNPNTESPLAKIPISTWFRHQANPVFDPVFSRLLIYVSDNVVAMWGVPEPSGRREFVKLYSIVHASLGELYFRFDSAGTRFLSYNHSELAFAMFDAATGSVLYERSRNNAPLFIGKFLRPVFSGDDRFFIGYSDFVGWKVFDADSGATVREVPVSSDIISNPNAILLLAGPQQSHLVAAIEIGESIVAVFNFLTGDYVMMGETVNEPIYTMSFSACGNFLMTGHSSAAVRCWAVNGVLPPARSESLWKASLLGPLPVRDGWDDSDEDTDITLAAPVVSMVPNVGVSSDAVDGSVVCLWGHSCVVELDVSTGTELRKIHGSDNTLSGTRLFAAAPQQVILM
jgi:hypothetical protein